MNPSRGISPEILYQHIENTVPFLFSGIAPSTPYSDLILAKKGVSKFTHYEYFELCLCAHYTTVASFVPTDVDNQIRKNLWNAPLEATTRMAELVLLSRSWDFRPWTARGQEGTGETLGAMVSGHQGEWFSVAVGAYAAHKKNASELSKRVLDEILLELELESKIFRSLKQSLDGIGLLRASTAIAHNLGDLDRVIDQWNLPADDPLRELAYKLGHDPNSNCTFQAELLEAGELNKAYMASENHRHYPLRAAKCLRRARDLFFPLGPFTDDWGDTIARHPLLSPRDKAEIAEALLEGFQKLSSPKVPLYGYARALAGLQRGFPGGTKALMGEMRAQGIKQIGQHQLVEIQRAPKEVFQGQWAKKALGFLKLT